MTRHRRFLALVGTALAAMFVLAACGDDVPANEVEVGQCTNQDLSGQVGEVDTVDCEDAHTAEAYAVFDIDGDDYPGSEEVARLATEGCTGDRFEEYVGVSYAESEIFSTNLAPTEQTWNDADDRTVICFAVAQDGSATQGSVKGANR
jgi:hypothetical protein